MLVVFLFALIISFIVVRIGAIAFQLTGLEWSLAKFQALSCFSGTGFTTKESELITSDKQRRKIATILIILGNAGFVIMIATLAGSLIPNKETIIAKLSESFLPFTVPTYLVVWINLAIIMAMVYGIYRIFTHEKFVRKMTTILRKKIIKREIFQKVSFEELLLATGGHGISRITVSSGSSVLNKTIMKSQLREYDIMVLAIVRGGETIPNPQANMKILLNDQLICFGKLENIKNRISMNP